VLAALGRFGRRLPGIKSLLLTVEMTRFFSVMAAMTKTGVPLADALASGTGVISDDKLREQLTWLRQSLVEGGVLRILIDRVDALPLATRRLLIAAERGGDLDSAFDALAEDMSLEVDKRSSRLLAFLEPAVIILMFTILAPIIIAVAIPMMTVQTDF
jgi:type II secretory pathway component PulF